jgi:hypothetical protein
MGVLNALIEVASNQFGAAHERSAFFCSHDSAPVVVKESVEDLLFLRATGKIGSERETKLILVQPVNTA